MVKFRYLILLAQGNCSPWARVNEPSELCSDPGSLDSDCNLDECGHPFFMADFKAEGITYV